MAFIRHIFNIAYDPSEGDDYEKGNDMNSLQGKWTQDDCRIHDAAHRFQRKLCKRLGCEREYDLWFEALRTCK